MRPGPAVEALTQHLARAPAELLAEPLLQGQATGVHVAAVVSDVLRDLGSPRHLTAAEARHFTQARPADRNLLRVTLVAAWLCHALRELEGLAEAARAFLLEGLGPLAGVAGADLFVTDPDRREELARLALAALGLLPAGETQAAAADRLTALSSVERARVLADTQRQRERARQLREKMEAERARQAAARYSSE